MFTKKNFIRVLFVFSVIVLIGSQSAFADDNLLLFADDFSTELGWIDESNGHIYRDPLKQWLVWNVTRSEIRRYYIPINADTNQLELNFRFNMTGAGGNGGTQFGLTESLVGTPTMYAHATGVWVSIARDTLYGPRVLVGAKYEDGSYDGHTTPEGINFGSLNVWRRARLSVKDGMACVIVWDDGGNKLGEKCISLSQSHDTYNYLMVFVDGTGGWEWGSGLIDDIEIYKYNNPPVADPGGPYSGFEGSLLEFDGTDSYDPDGDPLIYDWTFGDGSSGVGDSPNHVYLDNALYDLCLTVTDSGGLTDTNCTEVDITNLPPDVVISGPSTLDEGQSGNFTLSLSDPGVLDTHILNWDCDGDGFDDGNALSVDCYLPDGPNTVTVRAQATDNNGDSGFGSLDVSVNNIAPELGVITTEPQDPIVAVGTEVTINASFSDPAGNFDEDYTCNVDWDGDGLVDENFTTNYNNCSASHNYPEADVYSIRLTVTDKDGAVSNEVAYEYVVVYDPESGFVTGGGWIESSEGAFKSDPALTGNATFGFVSKYDKKTSLPEGNTQFVFNAGDLNFHSSDYDWLVVNQGDSRAQFKGTGTINGDGTFKFMLWASDGDLDTFRIKIWWEEGDIEHEIYDNGNDQVLGGGSIVVHTKK